MRFLELLNTIFIYLPAIFYCLEYYNDAIEIAKDMRKIISEMKSFTYLKVKLDMFLCAVYIKKIEHKQVSRKIFSTNFKLAKEQLT